METKEKNTATPYDLDGNPLGLQHVLAMFVGNLTPLLIITGVCGIESGSELQVALLQNAMLIAGIVTLIQRPRPHLSYNTARALEVSKASGMSRSGFD